MTKKHVKKPTISVAVRGERVYVVSNDDILMSPYTQDIAQYRLAEPGEKGGKFFISLPTKPLVAFMLRHTLKKCRLGSMDEQSAATLKELADKVPLPYAKMDDTGKRVRIIAPMLPHYRELFRKVDAAPKGKGEYTVPVSRAVDLYTVALASKHKYPPIRFHEDVERLFSAPIPGFDGSIDSLKAVPTSVLNVVSNNVQSPKSRSASKSTLAEKLESVGISSLYDLLFELPRRYVDKSAPSKIHELIVGQDATVIGKIASLEKFNSGKGLNIDLDLHGGGTVRVSFFAGGWMENKYKEDSEVIVTGKYKPWRNLKQISGSTIEFADSAATLPVTPIYSQSESKGITTTVISRAVQELIYRLGHVELPFYLREVERAEQKALEEKEAAGGVEAEADGNADDEGKDADSADTEANIVERRRVVKKTYAELIRAVHFPRNMKERDEAVKRLAFYELIEMQIVIQGRRKSDQAVSRGIVHKVSDNKAYASALNNLPFELTGAQQRGMEKMEKGMTSESPYHVLLNADVGAGKTTIATLASLIATDSGGQTVIVAPTEILARQLYQNVLKTKETLDEPWKSHLTVDFLTGSLKAKEKKEILQRVKSGETNVIVGTKSAMAKDVEYEDLSLVVIDEQQKFGAEDRSALLSARNDNKKPDLLMMTATPIPRSTAQVFYGDMDFIYLDEKPGGRLPIITEWVEENPASVVSNHVHRVWSEVKDEIDKGNQAFVIAPLVEDSEKIDASSVNATYESLKSGALAGVSIGVVHGKMKSEEAERVMQDFKDGVYSVLIASTVVEVGVDINSATAMVVLSADRLGASTLHQIRGRVGRNSMQSKCYLVADEVTDSGAERLQSLVDSDDGYEIAKADLVLRGEGKLFQSSQSGKSEFVFLKLARHGRWVSRASDHARNILDSELGKPAAILAAERFEGAERFV